LQIIEGFCFLNSVAWSQHLSADIVLNSWLFSSHDKLSGPILPLGRVVCETGEWLVKANERERGTEGLGEWAWPLSIAKQI